MRCYRCSPPATSRSEKRSTRTFPGSRTVWWDDTLCVNSWGLCRLVVTVGAAHATGPPLASRRSLVADAIAVRRPAPHAPRGERATSRARATAVGYRWLDPIPLPYSVNRIVIVGCCDNDMNEPVAPSRICRFPRCERPAAAAEEGGRRRSYCEDPTHNRGAWRPPQRRLVLLGRHSTTAPDVSCCGPPRSQQQRSNS